MRRSIPFFLLLLLVATPVQAATFAVIQTNYGTIKLELFERKAPGTVKNFLHYAKAGFYDGTIFHRVIKGFMIQGGGYTVDLKRKASAAPIKNEAGNGVKNERGTVAMARTPMVDSATSQFFINLKDNAFLNHRSDTPQGFGYCVFGKVVEGMQVVDTIAGVATERKGGPFQALPRKTVLIRSVRQVDR